jgi:predicted secreted protein
MRRRSRLLHRSLHVGVLGAVAIMATGSLLAACTKPSTPPVGQIRDVDADVDASAGAAASADANANAEATADAMAEASTSSDAALEASAEAGVAGGMAGAGRRVVKIDEGSEGKTIELAPGQTLVALLNANPTTGFDWAVIKAPAALGAPEMGFVSGGEQPGASGKRRIAWTLKSALPAGEQPVELGYARSFEKGVAPFKTFRFKVSATH